MKTIVFVIAFFVLLGEFAMAHAGPVAIAIHGGAGTILRENLTPETESAYRQALAAAVRAGHQVLESGGAAEDAVIAAITTMEDSPLFNAAHGAVFNHDGDVELDASIMSGSDLGAGAIAGVRHVRNPIRLADLVRRASPHVMLIGEGAEVFARQQGETLVENDYFKTERRRRQLERIRDQQTSALSEDFTDDNKLGTVGAVALDAAGNLAAGTSTGGMTNKRYGRVGDSPIIGAGTYADNRACAVSATGHGEYFIRLAIAHEICARVRLGGQSLQEAADGVILTALEGMGGDGGIIALDPAGNVVVSFNTAGMYRAAIEPDGVMTIGIYGDVDECKADSNVE